MPRPSTRHLRHRLGPRPTLSHDEALSLIAPGLPASDAQALASLLEEEFGIPIGLLRPDDDLERLVAPLPFRNPFTWMFAEAALEDGVSEINFQLQKQLARRHRTLLRPPRTIRELFVAWCGEASGLTSA